jgi:hypothetical protein
LWRELQVSDEVVGQMAGINREVDDAVELLVGTNIAEGFFLREGLSGRNQQFGNRHCAPP